MKPISYLYRELILGVLALVDIDNQNLFRTLDEDERACADKLKERSVILSNPLDFDEDQCESIYKSIIDSLLEDCLMTVQANKREGEIKTGLETKDGKYLELTEAVAIPISGIPDIYIGWTYFSDVRRYNSLPDCTEWMEDCYLVKTTDRVQTVKIFERRVALDRNAL